MFTVFQSMLQYHHHFIYVNPEFASKPIISVMYTNVTNTRFKSYNSLPTPTSLIPLFFLQIVVSDGSWSSHYSQVVGERGA